MTARNTSSGFTLLEVLVALTVLGLAMGAAFGVFGSDTAVLDRSRREQDAMMLAQSLLARMRNDIAVRPSHLTGMAGAMRWTLDVGTALMEPPPAQGFAVYPVSASVSWTDDRGQQVRRLRSARLAAVEIGAP